MKTFSKNVFHVLLKLCPVKFKYQIKGSPPGKIFILGGGEMVQWLKYISLMQKTLVWFATPMSGSSQPTATPTPGQSDDSGHCRHLHSHVYPQMSKYTYMSFTNECLACVYVYMYV